MELSIKQNRSLDVIGIGRLCIDLNANEIHRPLEETLTFTKYVGGSPANITIALSRLGAKTGFIGSVSGDAFGRYITDYLIRNKVNTDHVLVDQTGGVTGLAFTEIKSPTDCSILMYRDNAADLKLDPQSIQEAYIQQSKAMLISGTALAKSPSREAVFVALEWARKHGVFTIFDIDYRPYSWNSTIETGVYCKLVAERCDCIIGGREEFELMEDPAAPRDDNEIAKYWIEQGSKIVVVKRGGDGSTAFTADGKAYKGQTFPTTVVKTFGAGDAFAGAFIYGLLNGWDIPKCQDYGAAAASIVVSSHSCSDAMPTLEQIQDIITAHKK